MTWCLWSILCVGVCMSLRSDYTIQASSDQITSLPGLDSNTLAKYNMFSGYIDGMFTIYYPIMHTFITKPNYYIQTKYILHIIDRYIIGSLRV